MDITPNRRSRCGSQPFSSGVERCVFDVELDGRVYRVERIMRADDAAACAKEARDGQAACLKAIALAPALVEKMTRNIREVKARGAVVLGIMTPSCRKAAAVCDTIIEIPDCDPLLAPIIAVTPTQMFAYYMSVNKGLDVDKPRNLAKSVTVE